MSKLPMQDKGGAPRSLDALVAEAKQDLAPRIEDERWAAIEESLVARMAEERSSLAREVHASSSRARWMQVGAAALAAAAAIALVVKRDPGALVEGGGGRSPLQTEGAGSEPGTAGLLRASEGAGEVRVGGAAAPVGHRLRGGDLLEADGARAVLERPRKVAWLLESEASPSSPARVRVKSAGETLILGLEDGAVEAQVTPVPSGEAFAVDIASGSSLVRVAVHGTHLRVARKGSRVVVDLSEGVVSIGVPPRTGSTYGTLVTAPSHVEFDAADLEGTLRIDHAAASVRAPIMLVAHESASTASTVAAGRAAADQAAAAAAERPVPLPAATQHPVVLARPPLDPARGGSIAVVDPARPALPPREALAAAVRTCAAARSRPENVRMSVSSTLKLKITATGDVETAQFDPPLLPEIQSCAASAIYQAKIADAAGTTVAIPINFSY